MCIIRKIFFGLSIFFLTLTNLGAKQMEDDKLSGVVYFSDGASLIKYNFATKKEKILFEYKEESELGKEITHILYPVYLKKKNKMLFIGSDMSSEWIFESDLDLRNWKKYENIQNIPTLSVSPDETMVAYYKHPNKLVIKKYEDLEKADVEEIIADNILDRSMPLWLSDTEIVYDSMDNNIIKLDIRNNKQQILARDIFCYSITPNNKSILCANENGVYLYDLSTSKLEVLKKTKYQFYSLDIFSPDGKYFLFSKLREVKFTLDIFRLWNDLIAEYEDLYIYCLSTGEEIKIFDTKDICGGFWLETDPAKDNKQD